MSIRVIILISNTYVVGLSRLRRCVDTRLNHCLFMQDVLHQTKLQFRGKKSRLFFNYMYPAQNLAEDTTQHNDPIVARCILDSPFIYRGNTYHTYNLETLIVPRTQKHLSYLEPRNTYLTQNLETLIVPRTSKHLSYLEPRNTYRTQNLETLIVPRTQKHLSYLEPRNTYCTYNLETCVVPRTLKHLSYQEP